MLAACDGTALSLQETRGQSRSSGIALAPPECPRASSWAVILGQAERASCSLGCSCALQEPSRQCRQDSHSSAGELLKELEDICTDGSHNKMSISHGLGPVHTLGLTALTPWEGWCWPKDSREHLFPTAARQTLPVTCTVLPHKYFCAPQNSEMMRWSCCRQERDREISVCLGTATAYCCSTGWCLLLEGSSRGAGVHLLGMAGTF